jgi:outer membrane protein assembly factor BamA
LIPFITHKNINMKNFKLITLMILLFSFTMLSAQTEKGKFLIGASSNFGMDGFYPSFNSSLFDAGIITMKYKSEHDGQKSEEESDNMNSISFNPRFGFFIINNLSAGLQLNFSRNGVSDEDYKSHNSIYGAGPFLRYYIPASKVLPFIELYGTIGEIKSMYQYGNDAKNRDEDSYTSYGGGLGLAFPLGNKATFDGLVGYDAITMSEEEDNYKSSFTISNIGLKLGFTLLLGKK